jgi:hypothetical protein
LVFKTLGITGLRNILSISESRYYYSTNLAILYKLRPA